MSLDSLGVAVTLCVVGLVCANAFTAVFFRDGMTWAMLAFGAIGVFAFAIGFLILFESEDQ